MTPDHERWAEALALEKAHGPRTEVFLRERIAELEAAGDHAGVTRLREIQRRHARLLVASRNN